MKNWNIYAHKLHPSRSYTLDVFQELMKNDAAKIRYSAFFFMNRANLYLFAVPFSEKGIFSVSSFDLLANLISELKKNNDYIQENTKEISNISKAKLCLAIARLKAMIVYSFSESDYDGYYEEHDDNLENNPLFNKLENEWKESVERKEFYNRLLENKDDMEF